MIAAQCLVQVTDPTTGEVTLKARNLAMPAQSVRLQAAAAELLVKHGVMALRRPISRRGLRRICTCGAQRSSTQASAKRTPVSESTGQTLTVPQHPRRHRADRCMARQR
jgi:hypothetical protein